MGPDDIIMFETPDEQRLGLRQFNRVPDGKIYLFPLLDPNSKVTTFGMKEEIWVYLFDSRCRLVIKFTLTPNKVIILGEGILHMAETSIRTPQIRDWRFLKKVI